MMRLSPRYRLKVPHGLAIAGALLLLASTLADIDRTQPSSPGALTAAAQTVGSDGQAESAGQAIESIETAPQPALQKHKRFKVSLFLFRR